MGKEGAELKRAARTTNPPDGAHRSEQGLIPAGHDRSAHALPDWRPATLTHIRTLIHQADPSITEDIKWRKPTNPDGVPAWSRDGLICTGETYKDKIKITFAQGAALPDPKGLFNASLDAGTRRAIDLHEGDTLNAAAFKALIRAAVKLNTASTPR